MKIARAPALRRLVRALRRQARPRLGIGVGQTAVRAVLLEHGASVWQQEALLSSEASSRVDALRDALELVLASLPRGSGRPLMAVAAIGPGSAQLRRLIGLPLVGDARALAAVVREGAGRYFVKNGIPLVTSGVASNGTDGAWAAAFERPDVEVVAEICHRYGLRLNAIVPTAIVVRDALQLHGAGVLNWSDGDVDAEIEHGADGRLLAIRRRSRSEAEGNGTPSPVAVDETGDTASTRWADAIGAAIADPSSPLAVRLDASSDPARRDHDRARLQAAIAAFVIALLLAIASPLVVDVMAHRAATIRLAAISSSSRQAAILERQLDSAVRDVRRLGVWSREGRSMTLFLAALTHALPESTHLRSLRLERDGGTLVAVAPHGAEVVVQLEALPDITDARIVGSISSEPSAAAPGVVPGEPQAPEAMERVTVRFRWRQASETERPDTNPRRGAP